MSHRLPHDPSLLTRPRMFLYAMHNALVKPMPDNEFKNKPVGLGPYRFVQYQPGVELVLEANPDYWRKPPAVKRLVMKSVPEPTTRLAMLKKQEADVTYALYSALGEEVRRDPTLKLEPVQIPGNDWLTFVDQYDPKSPWHDKRVRLAANHAINRQAINEADPVKGTQSFLKDPEIDAWYEQQASERDRTKREALLHKMQQKMYDEALFAPIWELGFLCASSPRVAVSGLGLIPLHVYSAPYEDVQLLLSV